MAGKSNKAKFVQNRTPEKRPAWSGAFIEALSQTANVTEACRAADIGRQTAYDLRAGDADFAAQWDSALEEACDLLELEARRRAKEGVRNDIFYKGEVVGTEYQYSDTLMIFLLKAHRPEKYRENIKHEHGGSNGGPIAISYLQPVKPENA